MLSGASRQSSALLLALGVVASACGGPTVAPGSVPSPASARAAASASAPKLLGGTVRPPVSHIARATMSSTGKHLAVARGGDVTLVEVDSATPVLEIRGPIGPFAFDAGGSNLFFLRADGSLGHANVSMKEVVPLGPMLKLEDGKPYSSVTTMTVAGGRVIVHSGTEVVSADATTGKVLARRPLLREMELGYPTAVSPSGLVFAGLDDTDGQKLLVLDATFARIRSIAFSKTEAIFVHTMAFEGDDAVLISYSDLGGRDAAVVRVSIRDGLARERRVGSMADTVCDSLQVPATGPHLFCIHAPHRTGPPRVQRLARNTLAVVDTKTYPGGMRSTLDSPRLCIDDAQERLFAGGDTPVLALSDGKPVGGLYLGPARSSFALHEDGVLRSTPGSAQRTEKPISTFVGNQEPLNCPASAGKDAAFVCARSGNAFARIEGTTVHYVQATENAPKKLATPWAPSAIALEHDGKQLAVRNEQGAALVFDLTSGAVTTGIAAPEFPEADPSASIAFLGAQVLMIAGRPGRLLRTQANGSTEIAEVHHAPGQRGQQAPLAFVGPSYAWGDAQALLRVGLRATGPGPAVPAARLPVASAAEQARWLPPPTRGPAAEELFAEGARFAAGGGKSIYDERSGAFRVFSFAGGTSAFITSPKGAKQVPADAKLVRTPNASPAPRYALLRSGDDLYFAFDADDALVLNKFAASPEALGGVRYAVLPGLESWGPLPIARYIGGKGPARELALVPSELPGRPPQRAHWNVPLLARGTWPETGAVPAGKTGECRMHLSGQHPSEINAVELRLLAGRIMEFRAYSAIMADEYGAVPFDFPYVGVAMPEGATVSVGGPYRDGVRTFRLKYKGATLFLEGTKGTGTCSFIAGP
jgi:hypothetical protein